MMRLGDMGSDDASIGLQVRWYPGVWSVECEMNSGGVLRMGLAVRDRSIDLEDISHTRKDGFYAGE